MSVESEHILEATDRALIRRGLSMLMDEYEKEEKRVIDKLGSTPAEALLRTEKEAILKLRIEFAEPGSVQEVEASQNSLFEGDEPEEGDEGHDDEEAVEEVPEPFEGVAAGHCDE